MNYTFIAIACYIFMRAFQVFCEEFKGKGWYKITVRIISLVTLYAALSALIVFYHEIHLLGFDPSK